MYDPRSVQGAVSVRMWDLEGKCEMQIEINNGYASQKKKVDNGGESSLNKYSDHLH